MEEKSDFFNRCSETVKRLIKQKRNPRRQISQMASICAEMLIKRESLCPEIPLQSLTMFFSGKTVLVTGGGGSVGSELCRRTAALNIKRLVILDIYENNAYELYQELSQRYKGSLELFVEIASIRDFKKLKELFLKHKPDIVLHAAAHKHVLLMEDNPSEAIKNNIIGTYNVMRSALKAKSEKFILISTDKAVNPISVMGASKRFCEMMLQAGEGENTVFAGVRFGNVLGTAGSVLPLFEQQIAMGGPVLITDKRAVRFFMTVSEAAQLVVHAAVMAKQSQVMVLDMGAPVNILELAETLITVSGKKPYEEIAIKEIGLRHGEKLSEELLINGGIHTSTANSKIFTENQSGCTKNELAKSLKRLWQCAEGGSSEQIKKALKAAVPEYEIE